jgi:hypothetical protein
MFPNQFQYIFFNAHRINSINRVLFVMVAQCVLCDVGHDLYVHQDRVLRPGYGPEKWT